MRNPSIPKEAIVYTDSRAHAGHRGRSCFASVLSVQVINLISIAVLCPPSYASGGTTHQLIADIAIDMMPCNGARELIRSALDAYRTGVMFPDAVDNTGGLLEDGWLPCTSKSATEQGHLPQAQELNWVSEYIKLIPSLCPDRESEECSTAIAYLLGALAHVVTDFRFDKAFGGLNDGPTGVRRNCPGIADDIVAQSFTDRDCDVCLAKRIAQPHLIKLFDNETYTPAHDVGAPTTIHVNPCPGSNNYLWAPEMKCYKCPAGYTRALHPLRSDRACKKKVGAFKWEYVQAEFSQAAATNLTKCPGARNHLSLSNDRCYECPEEYSWTGRTLTDEKACKKDKKLCLLLEFPDNYLEKYTENVPVQSATVVPQVILERAFAIAGPPLNSEKIKIMSTLSQVYIKTGEQMMPNAFFTKGAGAESRAIFDCEWGLQNFFSGPGGVLDCAQQVASFLNETWWLIEDYLDNAGAPPAVMRTTLRRLKVSRDHDDLFELDDQSVFRTLGKYALHSAGCTHGASSGQ